MGLPNITFIKQQGRSGRTVAGQDYVSALLFYCADNLLPSGFSTTNRMKEFFSLTDAETAGIVADNRDEIQATGGYLVTAIGNNGDVVNINVAEPYLSVLLGTYIKSASETNTASVAAAITAAINARTNVHGYSATVGQATAETKATATATTPFVQVGNAITVPLQDPQQGAINLASYTAVTGDDTPATLAGHLVTAINAGSSGYSAAVVNTNQIRIIARSGLGSSINGITFTINYQSQGSVSSAFSGGISATTSSTIQITARKGLGIYPNTGNRLSASYSTGASFTGTITQFSGGVAGLLTVWHYQISEFFRKQNASNGSDGLFVGFFTIPGTYSFAEITTLQNFAAGVIRQIGIIKPDAYASGDLTLIHNVCVSDDNAKQNLSALYSADMSAVSDISTLSDLSLLTANKASSIIAQDGAALGNFLFLTTGHSIPAIGAALGALSLSAVSEDFAQPIDRFNMSAGGGQELDVPAFANGVLVNSQSVSNALLNSLDSKRHIFLRKFIGFSGTYFNDNHTAVAISSDYAYINDNRVIDKAIRGIYVSLLPLLNGTLILNSDGTLAATTIATYQNAALQPLFQMERDGDLSNVSPTDVYINPAQNVKATSTIIITVSLNENGVARQIQIPIGFKKN